MITRALTQVSSISGNPLTASNAGAISSRPSGSASHVCMPYIAAPPSRSPCGLRSEWTMPLPAVISFATIRPGQPGHRGEVDVRVRADVHSLAGREVRGAELVDEDERT